MQNRNRRIALAQAIAEKDPAADVRRQEQIGRERLDLIELFRAQTVGAFGLFQKIAASGTAAARLIGKAEQLELWNPYEQRA